MSVAEIEIDDEMLAKAMRLMEVTTAEAAVNTALLEYVASMERLKAAEEDFERNRRGEFGTTS